MTNYQQKKPGKRSSKKTINLVIGGVVGLFVLIIAVSIISLLMSEDTQRRQRKIQSVELLNPPPPPEKIEKPPEPEMKKEEIIEPEPEEQLQEDMDDPLADDQQSLDDLLGLDADGAGGADGFGLKAKKGGRSIIGGNGGTRFAWYTGMVQKEISDIVREFLEKNGGLPKGTHKTVVRITINDNGEIIRYSLLRSSGDDRVDEAVKGALAKAAFKEMPPLEMPRTLKFRITTKGKA